jgi:membrane protein DedA with SNARE-associated domain
VLWPPNRTLSAGATMGLLDADEPSPPAAPANGHGTARATLDRRHVTLLVAPVIVMWAATQVAAALLPTLSTENPTLLILLSSVNRDLIIAAASAQSWLAAGNAVPFVLYGIIGTLRLLAPDPFFYAIGDNYGDRAIEWMERRTPTFGQMLRELEGLFAKAGWLFVLILPNNYVCLLAGAARMRRTWFWALNIAGTIGRVIVMWYIGQALQEWIDRALGFVTDHRVPFLVLSIGFVGLTMLHEWRAGTSEIQSLLELEHDLEERDDVAGPGDAGGRPVVDRERARLSVNGNGRNGQDAPAPDPAPSADPPTGPRPAG